MSRRRSACRCITPTETRAGALPRTDDGGQGEGNGQRLAAAHRRRNANMNSTTMAPKPAPFPNCWWTSRRSRRACSGWCATRCLGAAAGLQLPTTVFTRFSDAVAARDAIDDTPPLLDHPQGLCRLRDDVIVDGVGPGRVNWIHPSGDVRVELARHPGSAEFYPAAAIRRAVAPRPRFEHEVVPIGLREANLVVERLHRQAGQGPGTQVRRRSAPCRGSGTGLAWRYARGRWHGTWTMASRPRFAGWPSIPR
jgi:hypothetical protein